MTGIDFGDLKRFRPFCPQWGSTRGGAIPRHYIDRFVAGELKSTNGRYLECGGVRYRSMVGPSQLLTYDCLDIDPGVEGLTINADLHDLDEIAEGRFDVVICTQVLQYVEDPARCISEIRRILAPAGKLILTAPLIEKDFRRMGDLNRFTLASLERLLGEFAHVRTEAAGNLFSTLCYIAGLGVDDLTEEDLDPVDPQYYHVAMASALK